jgi:hypothetical protein
MWVTKRDCHNGTTHIEKDEGSHKLKDIPQSSNDNGDLVEIGCSVDGYAIANHSNKEHANGKANLDTVNAIHGCLNGVIIELRSFGSCCKNNDANQTQDVQAYTDDIDCENRSSGVAATAAVIGRVRDIAIESAASCDDAIFDMFRII